MKNLLKLLSCILFSVTLSGSTFAQEPASKQQQIVEKQVDDEFQKMVKAAEQLNYDLLTQGVDDRHHAGFITNSTYFEQFDTLIKAFKDRAQGVVSQKISFENKKITVLSDRIVLLTANGKSVATVNNGNTFTGDFFWTFVYEKIDGQWKVIQSHQSTGK